MSTAIEFDHVGKHPLIIVMTPVRNEAWCLKAFLDSTSRWADFIVIADQISTDGSREIAQKYEKVVLIDNKNPDFNEAERQAMLVAKAREIARGRDTILFGLDADEIFETGFEETEDWQKICLSAPGDVFWFKWAEICPDRKHYWLSPTTYYPWMFHDDGKEPHGNYVRNMHSMRIPYPIEEQQMYHVDGFRVLHLAYLNPHRVAAKRRFYCFVDWEMNDRRAVQLYRTYTQTKSEENVMDLDERMVVGDRGKNVLEDVDTTSTECWFDEYVAERLGRHSVKELRKLPIWDEEFCSGYCIKDPRRPVDRIIHRYLRQTQLKKKRFIIRAIDKLLKKIY